MTEEIKIESISDRLPPQNIEAEEAILGGILLDPEAISRVNEMLRSHHFAIRAHQIIYNGMSQLHNQGKATDLMTVTTWLIDHGNLEQVGGQAKIAQLVERTVSAVNIDQYAELVIDKFTRRKLIQAGNEVTELGYQTAEKLEDVLDKAEQKIFALTQDRPQQDLVPIGTTLINTFQDIEERNEGIALPGIPCDFYDLDAMTGGFQRSDLIIVAGRPSMGKCIESNSEIVLRNGEITTIAEIYQRQKAELLTLQNNWQFTFTQPSVFVDDGIKPVFAVTTRLGRYIETTINHPYLTMEGWQPLANLQPGDHIAIPRQIPVFGKETISQSEVQILVDSIGLWGKKAHEKTVPNIVFQLERSLVALFLNRLFATDGWASILTAGQVQLGFCSVSEKLTRQIQHLLLRFGIIASLKNRSVKYQDTYRQAWQLDITDPISIQTFITEIGIFGKETALNKASEILANKQYHTNRDLIPRQIWQEIAIAKGSKPWSKLANRAGIKGASNIHVGKQSLRRERLGQLATALDNLPLQELATSDIYWDEIVSITPMGEKQVYDLTIPDTHNFVANDICVHNTSFSMNIAYNIALKQKLPTAIFSLEMSKEQLAQRLLSAEAKIESNRLRSGRISQNEWEPLTAAIGTLSELPIFIDDTPNITVGEMRSKCRRLQAEQGGAMGLVLIDYLQLMEGSSDNRVQELSKITRSLKGLARELSVPIIALSQLSRSVEARTNKRPMMSDLRESGSIEQDADLVIMLYRDEYYNPDSPDHGIAEIIITKHRNGPTGTVKLLFDPQYTKFRNLMNTRH